jgi:predicted HNH restriction endonuclease
MLGSTKQIDATSSAWNRDIVRKECESCKKQIVNDLEVHHIQPRASATNQILQDGTHQNDKRNLVVICQTCHDKVHAGNIVIGPLQATSDGPIRMIIEQNGKNEIVDKKVKKGKWSEEEHETIVTTLKQYSALSLKTIKGLLSSKHDIEISEGVLGKIRREI